MSLATSYGSVDEKKEIDATKKENKEVGRRSIIEMIDSFADSLVIEGEAIDNDTWVEYDEKFAQSKTDEGLSPSLEEGVSADSDAIVPKPLTNKRTSVVNLMNNVVGAGVLTMPAAVQAASMVNALVLMIITGIISATSFVLIGYLCSKLGCTTYRQLWSKAFGARSGFIVDISLLVNSTFGCLSFMILTCDLIEKSYPGLTNSTHTPPRWIIIWGATLFIILPLCHLKNLSALKYTSILAIIGFVYVWLLDLGKYFSMAAGTTRFADGSFKFDSGILFAISIFSSAYKAHYNSPAYFTELGGDMNAFMRVSFISFGSVIGVYVVFCIAAFGMFGSDTDGNVLKNFPQGDMRILWAWLAMALVTLFSYPLVFKTGRDSLFTLIPALARAQEEYQMATHSAVVTSLVALISTGACILPDVSLVVGMAGATVGAALCWTIPAAIYIKKAKELPWSAVTLSYATSLLVISVLCMLGCSFAVLSRN